MEEPDSKNDDKMGDKSEFDVVIVGAGFAGVTAAIICAREGLSTALLESGHVLSKYVMGSLLHTNVVEQLIPDLEESGAVERYVTSLRYTLLSGPTTISLSLDPERWRQKPYNHWWTINRLKFDQWYAKVAQESGATYFPDTHVQEIIVEDKFVKGVKTEDGKIIKGKITIIAAGANTPLVAQIGMQSEFKRGSYILGIREILSMEPGKIESRFNLEKREGAINYVYGDVTWGFPGSGFIMTNLDSLSIGVGLNIKTLKGKERNAAMQILLEMKNRTYVKRLIQGARSRSLFVYITVEKGVDQFFHLYSNGAMVAGDSAGFINANLYPIGTLLATLSGSYAAETAVESIRAGDQSERFLSLYAEKIESCYALKNMKSYSRIPYFSEGLPDFFTYYPRVIAETMEKFFTNDRQRRDEKQKEAFTTFKNELTMFPFLSEMWQERYY